MVEAIREMTLRELVTASPTTVLIVGQVGGFVVAVRCGAINRFLSSTRGDVRLFPNLTTLALYLQKLGISHFEVDAENYLPGRVRPARPDRAEALKQTRTVRHQASIFEGEQ